MQVSRPGACAEHYYQKNIFRDRVQQQLPSNYCLTVKKITAETWGSGSATDPGIFRFWAIDFSMGEDGTTLQGKKTIFHPLQKLI